MKKPIAFGKYTLLERINVGGMAEVFRAKAFGVEGFERVVAVKRILPNIAEDQDFITMFIDEAKIAVQLNHANIAQIFDLGVVDSFHYIALEHIWGRDLRAIFERCKQRGEPMPVAQACFIAMKVCEGLDYAHNKRDGAGRDMHLVHRDVSPQNVLVSFDGEVKLIDFGIAKAAGKVGKTQSGMLKGKFGYMSPEQVRGLPVDRRTDIFSCGVVLYEILTGERLFVGESDFSTLEKVRNVEILPPSAYNRRIPEELERIVLRALARDVEDRYQNAIDLHDDLQAFVYTAGEFYSRKELAAWMKKTFAREIDDEGRALEQLRQAPPPGNGRAPDTLRDAAPVSIQPERGDLEWDDDERETQIYGGAPPPAKPERPRAAAPPQRSDFAMGPPAPAVPPAAAMIARAIKARTADVVVRSAEAVPVRPSVFPEVQTRKPPNALRTYALVGLAIIGPGLLVLAGIAIFSDDRPASRPRAAEPAAAVQPAPPPPPQVDSKTGFDVTTDPPRAQVILDGNPIGESPLRVRRLLAGKHRLEIVPPVGYKGAAREIVVEQGASNTIDFKLDRDGDTAAAPSRLAVVKLSSEPKGARATLVDRGARTALGVTPTEVKLDSGRIYQVMFELDGYEPQTRDVTFQSENTEVSATLARVNAAAPVVSALPEAPVPRPRLEKAAPPKKAPPPRKVAAAPRPPAEQPTPREPKVTAPAETNPPADAQVGKLSIGAKPQCTILLDGKETGRMTPAVGLEVAPGPVDVTLVNGEFGIKERFTVTVKAGETTKVIKDFSDRIPQ